MATCGQQMGCSFSIDRMADGKGLLRSRRAVGKGHAGGRSVRGSYPYWPLWLAYFALGLNAWAASMAFHARDVRRTEARALLSQPQTFEG